MQVSAALPDILPLLLERCRAVTASTESCAAWFATLTAAAPHLETSLACTHILDAAWYRALSRNRPARERAVACRLAGLAICTLKGDTEVRSPASRCGPALLRRAASCAPPLQHSPH